MYTGTAEFQTANAKAIQKQKISGTVGEVAFDPSDVLAGSVTITNQCSDTSDYTLGGVYVGQLSMTFLKGFPITLGDWNGMEININFSLCIDEVNDTWETFSLGYFTVYEANATEVGIEVKAYDAMAKLDKVASWQPVGTLFQVLTKICQRCNVTLGMTELEVQALPNGTANYGLWPENDCSTYRDLLYWCCVTVGGFATIGRDGKLYVKSFKNIWNQVVTDPVLAWDKRCTGAKVSDYRTYYRGVYLTDAQTDEVKFYGNLSGGAVYDLGKNPFIQYGTWTTKDAMCNNILGAVQARWRPFEATIMSAPIWELGDILSMTGGLATGYESRTCVMSWSYNSTQGTKLACYGSNPALYNASSDKAADAASKSSSMNGISYKRYSNANEITVTGSESKVCDIYFTASKVTDVEMWHENLLTTSLGSGSSSMTVEAVYYLDGVELSRHPIETYSDSADHIMTLNYSASVDQGNHRWEVYLLATGGTATLDAEDAISVLKGQGLEKGDTWDGVIILGDEVSVVYMHITALGLTESVATHIYDPEADPPTHWNIVLSDNVGYVGTPITVGSLTESITITLVTGDQFAHCGEYLYCGMESVLL